MFRPKHFVTQTEVPLGGRIGLACATNMLSANWWAADEKAPSIAGHHGVRRSPPAQFRRTPISTNKKAAQPASKRDDVLTYISAKPARQDAEGHPANDNNRATLADLSFLDIINDEDEVAEAVVAAAEGEPVEVAAEEKTEA